MEVDFSDEYVETSDVEEQEEIQRARRQATSPGSDLGESDYTRPNKRAKLFHTYSDLSSYYDAISLKRDTQNLVAETPSLSQPSSIGNVDSTSPTRVSVSGLSPNPPLDKFDDEARQTEIVKLRNDCVDIGLDSPDGSQDPLLLLSPQRTEVLPESSAPLPVTSTAFDDVQDTYSQHHHLSSPPLGSPSGPCTSPRASSRLVNPVVSSGAEASEEILDQKGDASDSTFQSDFESTRHSDPLSPPEERIPASPPSASRATSEPASPQPFSLFSSPVRSQQRQRSATPSSSISPPPESPTTATRIEYQAPPTASSHVPSPPPESPTSRIVNEPIPEIVHQIQEQERTRYPLRRRQAVQLAPYSVDKVMYARALKSAPEAIVKTRSPGRHRHNHHPDDHYEEEGETQGDTFIPEADDDQDDAWEERQRPRQHHRPHEASAPQPEGETNEVLDLINELMSASSDSEEDRKMDALAKEGKRLMRAREKARKAKEKEEKDRQRREKAQQKLSKDTIRPHPNVQRKAASPPPFGAEPNEQDADQSMNGIFDYYAQDTHSDFDLDNEQPTDHAQIDVNAVDTHQTDTTAVIEIPSSPDSDKQQPRRLCRSRSIRSVASRLTTPSPTPSQEHRSALELLGEEKRDILCRMYPPGLAKKLLKQGTKQKPHRKAAVQHSAASSDEDDNGHLKPGQTRVRRVFGTGALKEIKGDSESDEDPPSDEEPPSDTSAPAPPTSSAVSRSSPSIRAMSIYSDAEEHIPRRKRKPVYHVPVYESSSDSEVEIIDDAAISTLLRTAKPIVSRKGKERAERPRLEKTLIDYMLSKTRVIVDSHERSNHTNHRKERKSGSKYKLDITTHGARSYGRERQALLHFDGYGRSFPAAATGSQKSSSSTRYRPRTNAEMDSEAHDPRHKVSVDISEARRKKSRRQKEKERKARIKSNGLYIVRPRDGKTSIKSGPAQRRPFLTLELEREGSRYETIRNHDATAKIRQWHGPTHRRPPSMDLNPLAFRDDDMKYSGRSEPDGDDMSGQDEGDVRTNPEYQDEEILILKDAGIPLLHSGIGFRPDSYIRKGWLHELVSVINLSREPSAPLPLRLHQFEHFDLSPDMPLERFCSMIEKVFEDLFDFATGIPEPDHQRQVEEWSIIARHVCQATSWRLSKLEQAQRPTLVTCVETQVMRLVLRVKSLDLLREGVDIAILEVDWFAVEISARVGSQLLTKRGDISAAAVAEAVRLLIHHLLSLGLDGSMKAVLKDLGQDTSEPSIDIYSADLWTRLIHLLSDHDGAGEPARKSVNTFWKLVLSTFRSSVEGKPADAATYEGFWKATFSFCALSQFSVRGMTLIKPHLPACWDLIKFLFDGMVGQVDGESESQDRYLGYILSRCLILNERWGWNIVDVSTLVKQIVDKVFAPRKFANLANEKSEFPRFMRKPGGANTISAFEASDSAYVLLLKFIVKASQEPTAHTVKGLSFSIKKLLSLSEPVSAIYYANGKRPDVGELSMLINRITAAVVAVQVDPSTYEYKVNQLRKTIPFNQADSQTRAILLRGLMYWAHFLVCHQPALKLDKLAAWAGEIATTLAEEWKVNYSPPPHSDPIKGQKFLRVKLFSTMLVTVVCNVIEAQQNAAQYPEPTFLANLKPLFLVVRDDTSQLQNGRRRLIKAFVNARFTALPPERPPLPKVHDADQEESQDMFGDIAGFNEIDWNNLELPEELVGPSPAKETSSDDTVLKQALADTNMTWFAYRCFKDYATDAVSEGSNLSNAHNWLLCWVGCRLIGITPEEKDWTETLRLMDSSTEKLGEPQRRKLDVVFSLAVLQRYPKSYSLPILTSFMVQNFLYGLVSVADSSLAIQGQYAAAFVSVDQLQHPLLLGCNACLPACDPETGIYAFSEAEFVEFRIPLVETILRNLDALFSNLNADTHIFAGFCKNMFSAMRNNLQSLSDQRPQYVTYASFVRQVIDILKGCEQVSQQSEFQFWLTWTIP